MDLWVSSCVWQLLTMQPFNSIITSCSLWGTVSTTIQLYFSFLAALICFLTIIIKKVMLWNGLFLQRLWKVTERKGICEAVSLKTDSPIPLQTELFFITHPSESPSALLSLFNCTFSESLILSVQAHVLQLSAILRERLRILSLEHNSIFLEGTTICYHGNLYSGKDVGLRLCEPQKKKKIGTRVVSYRNNYSCI